MENKWLTKSTKILSPESFSKSYDFLKKSSIIVDTKKDPQIKKKFYSLRPLDMLQNYRRAKLISEILEKDPWNVPDNQQFHGYNETCRSCFFQPLGYICHKIQLTCEKCSKNLPDESNTKCRTCLDYEEFGDITDLYESFNLRILKV